MENNDTVPTDEVKTPKFLEHKNASGYVTKLVNFDNHDMCPKSGRVELIFIKRKDKVDPDNSFRNFTDRKTGITYGIPVGTNKQGELEFQKITLRDFRIYDLSVLEEAKEWACVRMCHFVEGSPNQFGKPFYRILDHEKEAQKQIINVEHIERAINLAKRIIGNEIREFAMVLEIPGIDNDTDAIVKGKVFDKAVKSPEWFCKKYDDANRPVLTVLKRSLSTGLVIFDPMNGFKTKNGLLLGDNEFAAINYLSKNTGLLTSLNAESKERDRYYKETNGEGSDIFAKNEVEESPEQTRIKKLEEELERSNKLAAELNSKFEQLMNMKSGDFMTKKPEEITEVVYDGNNEEEFRQYAKLLKIDYWHKKTIPNLQLEVDALKKNK